MGLLCRSIMAECSVSARAYCKMLLHAAKYPHCAVNGVMLAEKPKSKDSRTVRFTDAIPLFHLSLTLAPMMEVALIQIEEYCKSHGLIIGGYYHANEHYEETSPKIIAKRIATKIHENVSSVMDACLFMIDNSHMSIECPKEAYHIYKYTGNEWKQKENRESLEEGALQV